MAIIQFKRGTRSQLDAARTAGTLRAGEPYLITDDLVFAIGLSTDSYADISTSVSSGTVNFNLGNVGETVVNTIAYTSASLAGFSGLSVVPMVNTDHPELDEFAAENLQVNIENIQDGVSFDLRLTAPNISWGTWRFKYVVSWS
jgi:hypothetical protein